MRGSYISISGQLELKHTTLECYGHLDFFIKAIPDTKEIVGDK
jgi:hypothetical protein